MRSAGPIFLSASVPQKGRAGFHSADPYLIREAVSALVEVILGRRLLVWGGHPAITPMIWEAANQLRVPYEKSVLLYQSKFFKGRYPEENTAFDNVIKTESVPRNRPASLHFMRQKMISDHRFSAGVFIGGMEGVTEEYNLFRAAHPNAIAIPLPSPGGTAKDLFAKQYELPDALESSLEFAHWFYKLLQVDIHSPRAGF